MKNIQQFSIICLLGFLSGLPQSLFSTTLQAWFTQSGYTVGFVSNLSLLSLIFIFRIFWGPLSDRFYIREFGRRKTWIFCVQIFMFVILECMAIFSPSTNFTAIIVCAALLALFSSIQDSVIDAHRIEYLDASEYGLGAIVAVYAYRLALLLSGGGALVFAHYHGFGSAYGALGIFFLMGAIAIYWTPEPKNLSSSPQDEYFWQAYVNIFQQPWCYAVMGLTFCLHFGQAFVSHSSILIMPFLMTGLGLTLPKIAFLNKVVGLGVQLCGGALSAFLLLRFSLRYLLLYFGLLVSLSNFSFYCLSLHPQSEVLLWFSIIFENIASGLCATALVVLLMRIVNTQFTASQFSFWIIVGTFPKLIAAPLVGVLYPHYGWSSLFLLSGLVSFCFVLFWRRLPKHLVD